MFNFNYHFLSKKQFVDKLEKLIKPKPLYESNISKTIISISSPKFEKKKKF